VDLGPGGEAREEASLFVPPGREDMLELGDQEFGAEDGVAGKRDEDSSEDEKSVYTDEEAGEEEEEEEQDDDDDEDFGIIDEEEEIFWAPCCSPY
jgi:hypothetical protein